MINFEQKASYGVDDLVEIVRILREPGGCPWDREQDHHSIRRNLLEEAYEAAEAIDEESPEHLKEELGDVLLQVVLHARMEQEAGRFDLGDVGDVSVSGSDEVLVNWEELKRKEKHQESAADSVDAVARSLPGLWRAEKVQKKTAKVGFDWPDIQGAMEKLREEFGELEEAVREGTNVSEEMGDLLFAAVNVARYAKVDPEEALSGACDKFARRFRGVEEAALAQGRRLEDMTLPEMDALWDRVKEQES